MNGSSGNLEVWVDHEFACVKITGRAGCACSPAFRALMLGLREKGWRRFALDLTTCQLMDSTFLGVLAGLGLRFSEEPDANPDAPAISLLNPSERISGLIENLGVSGYFQSVSGSCVAEDRLMALPQEPPTADREEIQRTALEAHQLLIKLNPANAPKFKDVCQFLEEDLKQLAARNEPPAEPTPLVSKPV
jgi:anti-anti-sigma regulatory factor